MILLLVVIVVVVIGVALSVMFLVNSSHGNTTSTTESSSSSSSQFITTSSSFSMEFAFPGALIASPDISQMNYSVSLVGAGNLTLSASAPQGLTAEFSPSNISLGSSILEIGVGQATDQGNYSVLLTARGNQGFNFNETVTVEVIEYLVVTIGTSFVPSNLTITANSNVTWLRLNGPLSAYDDGTHDVAFLSGTSAVSPALAQFESWSYRFSQPGEYDYYCKYHPFMKGEITVIS